MKNISGFWFAAAIRYLFVLIVPLALLRLFGAALLGSLVGPVGIGVFLVVTLWAATTTAKRYRERLAAPAAPVDHANTVRLNR